MTESLAKPYEPQELSAMERAFPAHAYRLMPKYSKTPDEFKRMDSPWSRFQADWFFSGLSPETEFYPRKGVDAERAFGHLAAIQGSYEPKHEHKAAAVAYLASLWFEKIVNGEMIYETPA